MDPHIFLKRLTLSFGIVDVAACWIALYLIERFQNVRYNGGVSEMNCVTYGVPKGSVLGPLVFPHIHSRCILDVNGKVEEMEKRDGSKGP